MLCPTFQNLTRKTQNRHLASTNIGQHLKSLDRSLSLHYCVIMSQINYPHLDYLHKAYFTHFKINKGRVTMYLELKNCCSIFSEN